MNMNHRRPLSWFHPLAGNIITAAVGLGAYAIRPHLHTDLWKKLATEVSIADKFARIHGCVLLYCIRSLGTDSIEFDYSLNLIFFCIVLFLRSSLNRCTSVPSLAHEIDFPTSLCAHNRSPKLVIFGPQLRFVLLRIRLTARSSLWILIYQLIHPDFGSVHGFFSFVNLAWDQITS